MAGSIIRIIGNCRDRQKELFDFSYFLPRIWLNVGYMANRWNNWTITIGMCSFFRGEAESGLTSVTWQIDGIIGR